MSTPSATPDWLLDLLRPGATLRALEPQLYSVLEPGDEGASYDARAFGYDLLIGSRLYSRIMWDASPDDYADFVSEALGSRAAGVALDIAAGSCLESARGYAGCERPVVVLDRSLGMLRRGRRRVEQACGGTAERVVYLQADARALPFRDGCIATLLSHGALHIFDDAAALCREWRRVLAPDGSAYVSSLGLAGRRGDRWLATLHRAGEVATPRTPEQVAEVLRAGFGAQPRLRSQGNFTFATIHPGAS